MGITDKEYPISRAAETGEAPEVAGHAATAPVIPSPGSGDAPEAGAGASEVEGHRSRYYATGEGDDAPDVEGHGFGIAGAPSSERGGHPGVGGSHLGSRRSG